MKRIMGMVWVCLWILCAVSNAAGAASPEASPFDGCLPVVVVLRDGTEAKVPETLLLILIHQETGKAAKVTLSPALFTEEEWGVAAESVPALLEVMEERLEIPLEKYVSLEGDVFAGLEVGEAREKGLLDLIQLGFSVLGSTDTNLSVGEATQTFQRAFAQKEQGLELVLPDDAEGPVDGGGVTDWEAMRRALSRAAEALR